MGTTRTTIQTTTSKTTILVRVCEIRRVLILRMVPMRRRKMSEEDALLDVEIIVGEEFIRDAKVAIAKLCDDKGHNAEVKTATPSAFEEEILRAKHKNKNRGTLRIPVACLETRCKRALFLVYPHRAHTLRTCAQFSPSVFGDSKSSRSLIARQLVEGLSITHENGLHMRGRVGLENCSINEDKAKEAIEKNVELTMTPLIEIGALARASNKEVTSTPTHSIENRDERDKEDAMEEDRRNLRGLTAAWLEARFQIWNTFRASTPFPDAAKAIFGFTRSCPGSSIFLSILSLPP